MILDETWFRYLDIVVYITCNVVLSVTHILVIIIIVVTIIYLTVGVAYI